MTFTCHYYTWDLLMVSCPHFPSSHCDRVCDDWSPPDMFDVMMMSEYLYLSWPHIRYYLGRSCPLQGTESWHRVSGLWSSPWLRVWSYWLIRQKIMYSRRDTQKCSEKQRWRNRGSNFHPSVCLAQFISMTRSPRDDCDTSHHPASARTRAVGHNVYNTMISPQVIWPQK